MPRYAVAEAVDESEKSVSGGSLYFERLPGIPRQFVLCRKSSRECVVPGVCLAFHGAHHTCVGKKLAIGMSSVSPSLNGRRIDHVGQPQVFVKRLVRCLQPRILLGLLLRAMATAWRAFFP